MSDRPEPKCRCNHAERSHQRRRGPLGYRPCYYCDCEAYDAMRRPGKNERPIFGVHRVPGAWDQPNG